MAIGGSAGGAVQAMYLELDVNRQLVKGASTLRAAWQVCAAPIDAWYELLSYGHCYLQLYRMNVVELSELHAAWLAGQQEIADAATRADGM